MLLGGIRYPIDHHHVTGDVGIQHPNYLERRPFDVLIFRPEPDKHPPVTTPPGGHSVICLSGVGQYRDLLQCMLVSPTL